jgi:transcriptional regulator with XRE-family HTH domain
MTRKQLKIIRERMRLTQAELGEKVKMARNSVARMESGRMIITPPMALLISFVAREAGVDASHPPRGRKPAEGKRANAKAAKASAGKARKAVPV